MIKVVKVKKSYGKKKVFSINELEIISRGIVYIKGKSGVGKTTFINCLFGLDSFDEGKILINDEQVKNLSSYGSFVFQDFQLYDRLSIYDNLSLSKEKCTKEEIENVLKLLDIEDIRDNKAYDISAGQKQRVAFARTLLQDRDIILLDEPISNLDEDNTEDVLKIIKKLSETKLIIVVSHEKLGIDYYNQLIEFTKEEVNSTITSEKEESVIKSYSSNKLSLKNLIKCSFAMNTKLGHKIASVIIMSICLFFVSLAAVIGFQNTDYQEYIGHKYYGIDAVSVVKHVTIKYENTMDDEFYYSVKDNEKHDFYTVSNIDEEIAYYSPKIRFSNIWYSETSKVKINKKEYDLKPNEILISKDIADEYSEKTITLQGLDLNIVDSFDLGLTQTAIFSKEGYDCYSKAILQNYSQFICIDGIDNLNTHYVLECDYHNEVYNLKEGNYPSSSNEIVLSQGMTEWIKEEFGINVKKGDRISFNLYSESNWCDEIGKEGITKGEKNYTVVGIMENNTDYLILTTEEEFYNLQREYCSKSLYNALNGYGVINPTYKDFKNASKKGLSIISDKSDNIESQIKDLKFWKNLLPIISGGFGIVALLFTYTYISSLVKYNQKELGILVALNYKRSVLFGMITVQTVLIILISVIVGATGSVVGTNIINNSFIKYGGCKILYFVPYVPFVILGILIVLTTLLMGMSYLSIRKKNNIQLIYGKDRK